MGGLSLAMMLGEGLLAPPLLPPLWEPARPEPWATFVRRWHPSRRTSRPRPSTSSTSSPAAARRTWTPWIPSPRWRSSRTRRCPGLTAWRSRRRSSSSKTGKSGIEVSEVFPQLGECVDDLCVIRSMWTDVPAHEPASRFMHTGVAADPQALARLVGASTAWAPKTRTCPASSRSAARRSTARRRSCPASTRA